MDEQQERTDGFDSFTGHPVDVKEDEFVRFSMIMARTFGALRMQLPTAVGFALYLLMTVVFVILEYQETGTVSWILIAIGVISLLCTLPSLVWIPKQTQRKARESYRANNDQEYYGEWTILDGVIIKKGGYKQWCVPLNETSVYIEDTDFMAFTSATDRQHVILFPARCMTEEMAAQVRQAVFDPACRIRRRVIHRMQAKAAQPIPVRPMLSLPPVLYDVRFTYQPEELQELINERGRTRLIRQLPSSVLGAVALGAVVWLWLESVWALVFTVPVTVLLTVLISSLNAAASAKRMAQTTTVQAWVTLTGRGVEYELKPPGTKMHMRWQAVRRASESETAVELEFTDGQKLTIPKRCIDDMDLLRSVIDSHRQK